MGFTLFTPLHVGSRRGARVKLRDQRARSGRVRDANGRLYIYQVKSLRNSIIVHMMAERKVATRSPLDSPVYRLGKLKLYMIYCLSFADLTVFVYYDDVTPEPQASEGVMYGV